MCMIKMRKSSSSTTSCTASPACARCARSRSSRSSFLGRQRRLLLYLSAYTRSLHLPALLGALLWVFDVTHFDAPVAAQALATPSLAEAAREAAADLAGAVDVEDLARSGAGRGFAIRGSGGPGRGQRTSDAAFCPARHCSRARPGARAS